MKRLLIIVTIAVIFISCKSKVETYTVKEQSLNEAVYASGEVMPSEYYFLKSNTTDHLLKMMVKEGDIVTRGKALAVLGTQSENRQLEILNRQVELASQNAGSNSGRLQELNSKIVLAKQKYEHDQLNASRYTELSKDKAVSEKDAEQARLQAKASLTEYRSLQQQYKAQKNELSANLLNARQQLALQNQSKEGKVLTSPINGKVFRVNFEEGELVQSGQPVLMVGIENKFKLELLVDERDISKIKLGQTVYFETDVFEGKQFEARISKIVPVLQKENRSFMVEAEVQTTEAFFPQSSVEANILIQKNAKALVIPSEYLLPGDSVTVQRDNDSRKMKVVPGIKNGSWVEIQKGLKAGDIVSKDK